MRVCVLCFILFYRLAVVFFSSVLCFNRFVSLSITDTIQLLFVVCAETEPFTAKRELQNPVKITCMCVCVRVIVLKKTLGVSENKNI